MGNNVQTEGKTPPIPTPPSPPTKPVGDVRINLGLTPTNELPRLHLVLNPKIEEMINNIKIYDSKGNDSTKGLNTQSAPPPPPPIKTK